MTWEVVLLRANGRQVKASKRRSRYGAKLTQRAWEEKYDHTYRVEIRRVEKETTP